MRYTFGVILAAEVYIDAGNEEDAHEQLHALLDNAAPLMIAGLSGQADMMGCPELLDDDSDELVHEMPGRAQ